MLHALYLSQILRIFYYEQVPSETTELSISDAVTKIFTTVLEQQILICFGLDAWMQFLQSSYVTS